MRRTELKSGGALQRRTEMPRGAEPKRTAYLNGGTPTAKRSKAKPPTAPPAVIAAAKERSLGFCEVGLLCLGSAPATETAHRRGKGTGGVGKRNVTSNVVSNLLRSCSKDHRRIDNAEVADAERLGLKLRHTVAHPREMPVHHYRLGWVLLDDAGGWRLAPPVSYERPDGLLPVVGVSVWDLMTQGGKFVEAMERFGHINCPGWSTPREGVFTCGCGSEPFALQVIA
jgi:hypothetical protein